MNINLDRVPLSVNEALDMFLEALDDDEKKAFTDIKERDIALFHHSLGQDIRNMWSIWEKDTPLVNDFKTVGITHPDDMSAIILVSTWRHLHNKPLKLKEQVQYYQNYWTKKIGKPIP